MSSGIPDGIMSEEKYMDLCVPTRRTSIGLTEILPAAEGTKYVAGGTTTYILQYSIGVPLGMSVIILL